MDISIESSSILTFALHKIEDKTHKRLRFNKLPISLDVLDFLPLILY